MIANVKWEPICFGDISSLPKDLAEAMRDQHHSYVISQTEYSPLSLPTITRDSALQLLCLHPPLVHGKHYHCICGHRVMNLATPHLKKTDLILVGILPNSTKKEKLLELINAEYLLNQIAFASNEGLKDLILSCEHLEKSHLQTMAPALATNLKNRAKVLGVSRQTLYKLRSRN